MPSAIVLGSLVCVSLPSAQRACRQIDIDTAFADKLVKQRGMAMHADHPRCGELKLAAQPNTIEGHADTIRHPPAESGADTILRDLGLSEVAIADFRQRTFA